MPTQGAFVLEASDDSPVLLAVRYFGEQLFGEDEEEIEKMLMTAHSLLEAEKNADLINMMLEHFPKVLESTGALVLIPPFPIGFKHPSLPFVFFLPIGVAI